MNKVKILQIVPSLSQANGVASYISTYFQNINKTDFEFTFLVLNKRDQGRYEEIIDNGGKIIELYKNKNIFKYIKEICLLYKNNNFDIVHCHTPNYGVLFLYLAKKYKIKNRILHSHVNKSADKIINRIRNAILRPLSVHFANNYIACSTDAGKFMFKKKNFIVINNAIDLKEYAFNPSIRDKLRKKYNINEKIVIGEFGRLCIQKNQLFLLDIFKELLKINDNYFLVLAGNGELQEKIENKINEYNIEDKVLMLGSRNDLNELYNMLDYFVLPSIYEGLGIVLIEAQANGLKCFTSEKYVPKAAKVSDLLLFIKLNKNPNEWAKIINNSNCERKNVHKSISECGYNIKNNASVLRDYYINLMEE